MAKKEMKLDMTLEEAKAFRASLYKPLEKKLSDAEKRNSFKLFWAQNRKKFGKKKDLESILWMHLEATGNDHPENFEKGMQHFGLKKVR